MTGKFRQCAERLPFRHAFRKRLRPGIGAALDNPLPQLIGGNRAVSPPIRSNDSVHIRYAMESRINE